ncbi:DgyrCDS5049 [Dimorphilus gyrociliatus]|uniref:DgyrCDS5049 n=1 Tax=Dimorphilus gyrociliatus TaxID=2664684 RepID=A0A7I8VK90_9ANNE|nr:DgyrCDS5049 [Dimorphilus gyrociliatus]
MAEDKRGNRFKEGENVYVLSSGLVYDAKILEIIGDSYRVHYNGWNSKWDETVKKQNVMPINDETHRMKIDSDAKRVQQRASKLSIEKKKYEKKRNPMGESKRGRKRKKHGIKRETIKNSFENLSTSLHTNSCNGQKAEKINKSFEIIKTAPGEKGVIKNYSASQMSTSPLTEQKPHLKKSEKKESTESLPSAKSQPHTKEHTPIVNAPERKMDVNPHSEKEMEVEESNSYYKEALKRWAIKAKAMRLYPINIPDQLFNYTTSTYREIRKDHKVFNFPLSHTISEIFTDYLTQSELYTKNERLQNGLRKQVSICQCLFNVILGKELLTVVERPQYARLLKENPGIPLTDIFGAPHLVRLLFYINRTFSLIGEVNSKREGFYLLLTDLGNFLTRNYEKYLESNRLVDVRPEEVSSFGIALPSDSDEE